MLRGEIAGEKWTHLICVELSVSADVEEAAGSIVRSSTKGISVREELNGVDIRFVTREGLHSLARTNIPQLGERVASTGYKDVVVGGVDADAHHISEMVGKLGDLCPGLDIPQHTGHIARRGNDATVIDEATTRKVT